MSESTPKPRTCRVAIQITDDRGKSTSYALSPATPPEAVQGYRLRKLPEEGKKLTDEGKVYQLTLTPNGHVSCTCPGFTYSKSGAPCKHVCALSALGMLDPAEYLRVDQLRLQNELTADQLEAERQALAARRAGKKSRVKKAQAEAATVRF